MLLYWILLPIVWVLMHIVWRVRVVGRDLIPRGRPIVVAPNHLSELDPVFILVVIFRFRRFRILAKQELFRNPFVAWFLRCMGAVPIDRGHGDLETVNRVTEECKKGTGVLIFPEGTRSKDGKLGKLKSGAFVIAGQAGADMVPCRIIYDTPDHRMHLFCRMRICFGQPIPAEELRITDPRHQIKELRALRTRLTDALEELYRENSFEPAELPAADPAPQADPKPET